MRPLRPFNFNTSAELFPAAIRKKKRAGFAYRRFGTAAEAVRVAMEELPADSLNGAYLQVEEARFDQNGIRTLYESEAFPLPRRVFVVVVLVLVVVVVFFVLCWSL